VAKITKMQQRRGLRRDLPLPLAPGELGLATDSRELFIGNDVTDSLSGIQNRTIQLGFFATGFDFTNSHLQNNITEFIVKRDVITGVTGIGPTLATGFSILSVHSGLSATAGHASGVKLEGGINDQSLTVHKYSPATSSHAKLIPGDPDGTPITINDYKLIGGVGTLGIQFAKALVTTDVIYVVHLKKKDLETYLINAFNASYNTPAGGGTALTNLTQKIDLSQLYFDQSTGEGFVGFNDSQIPKADNSTNVPNAGVATSSSNKSVKEWFEEYLVHAGAAAEPHLNSAISGLGDDYWGFGEIATMDTFGAAVVARTAGTYTGVASTVVDSLGTGGTFNITVNGSGAVTSATVATGGSGYKMNDTITIADANLGGGGAANFTMSVATLINVSNNGGKGIAKFGQDAATTVPTYSMDEDLTFATRSHIGAKNLSTFLNQSWLSEGSNPTRQLSHLRSNIRVVTDENVGDVFSNLTIGNPSTRTVSDTTSPGSTSTNPVQGTQVYRTVGSVYTTTQALVGVVRYNLTSISNLEIDYSVKFTDSAGSPTYYVTRIGRASVGFPLVNGANVKGHGAILDQWNEMDALSATGAVAAFSVTQTFEFATIVSSIVTIKGDPVIVSEYAGTSALSDAAFNTKYGVTPSVALVSRDTTAEMAAAVTADTQVFWVDNDSTSSTYQKYFGFLLYKNLRGVDGTIEFIQRRF
jgi:hypothetical protein